MYISVGISIGFGTLFGMYTSVGISIRFGTLFGMYIGFGAYVSVCVRACAGIAACADAVTLLRFKLGQGRHDSGQTLLNRTAKNNMNAQTLVVEISSFGVNASML